LFPDDEKLRHGLAINRLLEHWHTGACRIVLRGIRARVTNLTNAALTSASATAWQALAVPLPGSVCRLLAAGSRLNRIAVRPLRRSMDKDAAAPCRDRGGAAPAPQRAFMHALLVYTRELMHVCTYEWVYGWMDG
jgi:hypothetical protein